MTRTFIIRPDAEAEVPDPLKWGFPAKAGAAVTAAATRVVPRTLAVRRNDMVEPLSMWSEPARHGAPLLVSPASHPAGGKEGRVPAAIRGPVGGLTISSGTRLARRTPYAAGHG